MKDITEIQDLIKNEFSKMKTQKDLLRLLNQVKRYLDESAGRKFVPLKMKSLNFFKNVKASGQSRYRTFQIKKKSGKMRTISAPVGGLKVFQKCLNFVFQTLYEANDNACGFVPGKSIADGAAKHVGKNYVLNIDLKDFFDSIEIHRVKAIFTLPPFNLLEDKDNGKSLPYVLANLCCTPKEVTRLDENGNEIVCTRIVTPQGAPTSPILTNLICRQLDRRLGGLAKRFRISYSRYADDITFSSNKKSVFQEGSEFWLELRRIVEVNQKFRINEEKTRVQSKYYRQEVTGLIVNEKVNVTKRYIKQLRMWLYLWEHYGYVKANECFQRDYRIDKGSAKRGKYMENVIEGKLNYLKMIAGEDNVSYKKLADRFDVLIGEKAPAINVSGILDVWENDGIEAAAKAFEKSIEHAKK